MATGGKMEERLKALYKHLVQNFIKRDEPGNVDRDAPHSLNDITDVTDVALRRNSGENIFQQVSMVGHNSRSSCIHIKLDIIHGWMEYYFRTMKMSLPLRELLLPEKYYLTLILRRMRELLPAKLSNWGGTDSAMWIIDQALRNSAGLGFKNFTRNEGVRLLKLRESTRPKHALSSPSRLKLGWYAQCVQRASAPDQMVFYVGQATGINNKPTRMAHWTSQSIVEIIMQNRGLGPVMIREATTMSQMWLQPGDRLIGLDEKFAERLCSFNIGSRWPHD
jgi:hypothetical protein